MRDPSLVLGGKDWRRVRFILAQCALCQAATMAFLWAQDPFPVDDDPRHPLLFTVLVLQSFNVILSGLGSALLVWGEVGKGMLPYLWSLPVEKPKIWRRKVGLSSLLYFAYLLLLSLHLIFRGSAGSLDRSPPRDHPAPAFYLTSVVDWLTDVPPNVKEPPRPAGLDLDGELLSALGIVVCPSVALLLLSAPGSGARGSSRRGRPRGPLLVLGAAAAVVFIEGLAAFSLAPHVPSVAVLVTLVGASLFVSFHEVSGLRRPGEGVMLWKASPVLLWVVITGCLTGLAYLGLGSTDAGFRLLSWRMLRPWGTHRYYFTLPRFIEANRDRADGVAFHLHSAHGPGFYLLTTAESMALEPLLLPYAEGYGDCWRIALLPWFSYLKGQEETLERLLVKDEGKLSFKTEEATPWCRLDSGSMDGLLAKWGTAATIDRVIEANLESTDPEARRVAQEAFVRWPTVDPQRFHERRRALLAALEGSCEEAILHPTPEPFSVHSVNDPSRQLGTHNGFLESVTLDPAPDADIPQVRSRWHYENYPCTKITGTLLAYWRPILDEQDAAGWDFTAAFNRMFHEATGLDWRVADAARITWEEFEELDRMEWRGLPGPRRWRLQSQWTDAFQRERRAHPERWLPMDVPERDIWKTVGFDGWDTKAPWNSSRHRKVDP